MIKICSPQLGMSPISSLGGEIYDYQTLKGFTKRGIKVYVYLPKDRNFDKVLQNFYIEYCFVKHILPPIIYSFLCLPYLFRTYKKIKFDILRIHSPSFLGLAGLIFHLFYPKVPILSSAVTVDGKRIYYSIEKAIYKISSKIIVQSEYMKRFLIKKYQVKASKIAVTYGGRLDGPIEYSRLPKEKVNIKQKDKVMLFMGALIERKNPLFALDIFFQVKKIITNLKFVVIGEGVLLQVMKEKVRAKRLENEVFFLRFAYGEDKSFWFSRMDLLILPSSNEGFGLVTTEALSFGKVVMLSNKAAFKEIIDNDKDGFTLPLSNKKLWVDTAVQVLTDKKRLKTIGKQALKKVKSKYSWERTYDLNKNVIESIIG